ncbi:MAG: hypothetical protein Q9160_004575 [Pyrenula sp. 1 TL-2023]
MPSHPHLAADGKPTSSRTAYLGTAEARGFEELRAHVLAQEREKEEEETERRLDLGGKEGFLKRVVGRFSGDGGRGGQKESESERGHGEVVYEPEHGPESEPRTEEPGNEQGESDECSGD